MQCPKLAAGLYRVSCIWDAKDFDWDRLWFPMHEFENKGQITGPWDFDFERIEPTVPAWWLSVNGERVGLVACARPSPATIAKKRMTLGFCFEMASAGQGKLTLEPFNDTAGMTPLEIKIEPEPYDSFEAVTFTQQEPMAKAQRASNHWKQCADKAHAMGPQVQKLVNTCMNVAVKNHTQSPMACPLALAYLGYGKEDAKEALLAMVRHYVGLEHWGNQAPAGYGHNCDMGVAEILQSLSMAYHWFHPELQAQGLAEPLLKKIQIQLKRFFNGVLCWADFWGGSLSQDHGHRSLSCFGVAAIHMLDLLPEAAVYASFAVHRMNQALALILPDGGIPFSSYTKIHLYMDDMSIWRDVLLHATGQEVYETLGIEKTVDFVISRLDANTSEIMAANPRGDRLNYYAGWGFLSAMAERSIPGAHALVDQLIKVTAAKTKDPAGKPCATIGWMLTHLPVVPADDPVHTLPTPKVWDVRPVQGQMSYRPANQTCVCVQLPSKLQAHKDLHNPCDRNTAMPFEGHFTVHLAGHCLVQTAEGGYQMRSDLSNVLLIDGKGGWEDQNYAMGIPGITLRDVAIATHRFDTQSQQGYMRLNLAAMHDRDLGVVRYTRELFFSPVGMRCQDVVTLTQPRQLSWHFQSYANRQIKQVEPNAWQISHAAANLRIKASATQPLVSGVHPTEVVWSYQNENDDQPFQHVRYATREPVSQLACAFDLSW